MTRTRLPDCNPFTTARGNNIRNHDYIKYANPPLYIPSSPLFTSHSHLFTRVCPLPQDLTVLQMCIKNQVLALSSPPTGPIAALRRTMMLAELDRVKYIVADYLRTRVRKIESNVAFYRKKYPQGMCRTTNRMFMTQPETAFCGKFFDLLKSQQHEMVLKHHHKMFQGFEEDEMIVEPEAGTYVFGRIRKDKEAADDEEEEEDLLEGQLDSASVGDMLLVRYDKIIEKVIRGEIELIV